MSLTLKVYSRVRIAVVEETKCKPSKCNQECKKLCPVERIGKECVTVTKHDKIAMISETNCIGCGICSKKCPMGAITIINLPHEIEGEQVHRYGVNSFMLHRLPMPRRGQVLGIVGANGTGKSTAMKIMSGGLKPNFGDFETSLTWDQVVTRFRGSELQKYFTKMQEDKIKVVIKPQNLAFKTSKEDEIVSDVLHARCEKGTEVLDQLVEDLDLKWLLPRETVCMSGGEMQRFAITYTCIRNADVYLFDEPSSFLDIKQRIKVAHAIRSLLTDSNYVLAVEHDLAMLDLLSDFVCILYGHPGAYGVVTLPLGVREGINCFLDGFIRAENMRIRPEALDFNISVDDDVEKRRSKNPRFQYPAMTKKLGDFTLQVEAGCYDTSEIIVLLGENGTGKTTFIQLLAGKFAPDNPLGPEEAPTHGLVVSYKPQMLVPTFKGTVRALLQTRIGQALCDPVFVSDVMKPMKLEPLMGNVLNELSGGELQRVALCLALGKDANIYLLDEPSAFLDSEQRVIASKVIKRYIMHKKKTAFVVEHDLMMASYVADRIIVYDGAPAKSCVAHSPQSMVSGMNSFLKSINTTIRRDPVNYRPRFNKPNCVRDREQKAAGAYFYVGEEMDY